MAYIVSAYYPTEGVLAQTEFEALTDAQAFFMHLMQPSSDGAAAVWLKQQQGNFEQYLLHYGKPRAQRVTKKSASQN
jgi:hypothetical protein